VLYRRDHFVSGSAAAAGGQASRHFCIHLGASRRTGDLGLSGEFKAMRWTSLASRRSARLEMAYCGGSVMDFRDIMHKFQDEPFQLSSIVGILAR
jgi:hypothetical protein